MNRRRSLFTCVVLTAFALTANAQSNPNLGNPAVSWNLQKLNQGPYKLIKGTPDPQRGQVRFVVELTRPLVPSDLLNWDQGTPFTFEFLDEDGVTIQVAAAKLEGLLVPKTGTRVRIVLNMPNAKVLDLTRTIRVD